jgi:hypothetical protein
MITLSDFFAIFYAPGLIWWSLIGILVRFFPEDVILAIGIPIIYYFVDRYKKRENKR